MINLAVIGLGKWGKNIVSTIGGMTEVRLGFVCATRKETLERFTGDYQKFTDWREILNIKNLDGVVIATPPSSHMEIVSAFVEKKIPVFVEKPMVLNTKDGEKLRNLVKEKSSVFMVGFQFVYNDYIAYLKRELEKGTFGEILEVKSEHILSPSRPDYDIFSDACPHPLSIFEYLFKTGDIKSISGKIEHKNASVKVCFEKGSMLEMYANCEGDKKTRKTVIRGAKGTAILDETLEKDKLSITKDGKTSNPSINAKPPLLAELEHFVDCIKKGTRPVTDVEFGYRITELLELISLKLK